MSQEEIINQLKEINQTQKGILRIIEFFYLFTKMQIEDESHCENSNEKKIMIEKKICSFWCDHKQCEKCETPLCQHECHKK